jgi:hypothetical protein
MSLLHLTVEPGNAGTVAQRLRKLHVKGDLVTVKRDLLTESPATPVLSRSA